MFSKLKADLDVAHLRAILLHKSIKLTTFEHTAMPKYSREEQRLIDANANLTQALAAAEDLIKEQNEILEQLKEAVVVKTHIVAINKTKTKVAIVSDGKIVDIPFPKQFAKQIGVGSFVNVLFDGQVVVITDVMPNDDELSCGVIVLATSTGNNGKVEVDFDGQTRVVTYGQERFQTKPEPGDRLVVDHQCFVALANLGKDERKFSYQGNTGVTWDDIGGLEDAKEALRDAIEAPLAHKELFKAYQRKPVKGIMLYGPHGCGKTMLAKAAATSLARTHGAQAANTGFIYVKGPELLDKYVGNTEAQIRSLFARARTHFKKHGYPAILFIDEADALLGKRGERGSLGMETTVVPQFLSEMDGLEESGAFVLLATNRPDMLDPAVIREGRIDGKVLVSRPDRTNAEDILRIHLRNKPMASNVSINDAAKKVVELVFSDELLFYEIQTKDKMHKFTLGNLINGAMLATVVESATRMAMHRDINSGNKRPSGLGFNDLHESVKSIFTQNLDINHDQAVAEFCEPLSVVNITKPVKVIQCSPS